ncbi:MAG: BatA and WFA domain-containing protein, partial [Planctomycetes bacterium]|nr:BatA and WFA domain-containing protein [Planctomycetota bacterium]
MWQFLDVGALWWLAAGIPAITILYFLKLRRQDHVVASTLLWRRSVQDLRVNAPIQMIKRNLLLLLQLLVITMIILALARPFTKVNKAQGRRAALIIDASASMGTRDVDGKSRLEAAKEEALKIIDNLGVAGEGASSEDELCIILAADRPQTLCGLTSDKDKLRRIISEIKGPLNTTTDMNEAINMAVAVTYVAKNLREVENTGNIEAAPKEPGADEELEGLSNPNRQLRANVIILSDGGFPDIPSSLAEKLAGASSDEGQAVGAGSRFISFGKPQSDNLAIVAVDLRADVDGANDRQLFVRL